MAMVNISQWLLFLDETFFIWFPIFIGFIIGGLFLAWLAHMLRR